MTKKNEESINQNLACLVHKQFPHTYVACYSTISAEEKINDSTIRMHHTYRIQFHDANNQNELVLDVFFSIDDFFSKHILHQKTHSNRIVMKRWDYGPANFLRNAFYENGFEVDLFYKPSH